MDTKDVVLALDLGGTNTVFALVDKQGHILYENRLSTGQYDCFVPLIKAIRQLLMPVLDQGAFRLQAVGMGAPNGNFYKGTIEFAPNLPWRENIEARRILEEHFAVPASLTNDANAAAYGELYFGGARGMKNFGVITLGTGLGSGIVVDGKMLYGHQGFGGEFGHVVVERNGRFCGCGKQGCLETYVSATGIKNTVVELLATRTDSSALRKEPVLSGKTIEHHALQGDALAREAFAITGRYLGEALANYSAIFDPEAIFLFGGLSLAGELIFEPTRQHLEQHLMKYHRGKVKLLPSELNDKNAAVLGAAALAGELVNLNDG